MSTLTRTQKVTGVAAAVFKPLAAAGVSVDTIVQNASVEHLTDLTLTVSQQDAKTALKVLEPVSQALGSRECIMSGLLGEVSIVGTGMQNAPGYAARMFRSLREASINIEMITTSEIRITCLVAKNRVNEAVQALHQTFELDAPKSIPVNPQDT